MPEEKEANKEKEIGADDSINEISKDISALTTMTSESLENNNKQFAEMEKTLVNHKTLLDDLAAKAKPVGISLPGLEDEKRQFSIYSAVNAIITNDWSKAAYEKEVFNNTRAMGTTTGEGGGYLVPMQAFPDMIELLRANSIVMSLGATSYSNLTGSPFELTKQTGGATVYWVDEDQEITASDLTFGQINMTPHSIAALVKVSNRSLALSNPSLEATIRRDITQGVGLGVDLAALRGSGTKSQPLGIVNISGINTVSIDDNGGIFTLDHAKDMEGTLEDVNALNGSLGFAMHGKVKRGLMKLKVAQFSGDTGGEYIMLPMSDSNLVNMLGYNLKTSTQIPTNLEQGTGKNLSEVIFGNWQDLIIAQWGGLEISASKETSDAFAKDQTWIKIIQLMDIAVRHPASFCLINDAATT